MDAGPNSIDAFNTAMLRAQETGLGNAAEAEQLRTEAVQEQSRIDQLLAAAVSDSYEVWELRHQWRLCHGQVAELSETLERWRESFAEARDLDLQRLLPNLAAFGAEIEGRFTEIWRMLADQAPERQPRAMELALNQAEVRSLSHFHTAALMVTRSRLQHLERLTRSLFESLDDIKGFGRAVAVTESVSLPGTGILLDPDRLASVVRILIIVWLAFLAVVYVDAIPGGIGIVSMAVPFGMALATNPQLPVSALFAPAAGSVLFAGILYIFLMPQLSSFVGLGLMLFAATFAICYLFAAPRQALGRVFGLAMFVTIASISNQQT